MLQFKVKIQQISDIVEITRIFSKFPNNVDVISGKFVIDGKSVLGWYYLSLNEELICRVYETEGSTNLEAIKEAVKNYIV